MYVKYPRTHHLPWSETMSSDDKVLQSASHFIGMNVIVSEKMDGENTTMYCNHIHARSIDSQHHISRDWIKSLWNQIRFDIPKEYRICGENVYAKHSIHYTHLKSYFLGFSVWNGETCLSWNETLEWFELFNIEPVNVLYTGIYNEGIIKGLWSLMDHELQEGYVIRNANQFNINDFGTNVAKFVRREHVQSSEHWTKEKIIPNIVV